ncbi:MAG TPA: response regulator [Chthoniobacteraceae bacterium]|nr:response regulator [Chthoniobacteraceae bacterium]
MDNQPKRILIVDDEAGFTRLMKLMLERTGHYVVQEENDGSMALAAARQFIPDLVLLDIVMPKLDGGDVARQITSDPMLKNVKIIFLTAIVSEKEAGAGGIGGFPFVAKPVSIDALKKVIDEALE